MIGEPLTDNEAQDVLQLLGYAWPRGDVRPTGLRKRCPRCWRYGVVLLLHRDLAPCRIVVVWPATCKMSASVNTLALDFKDLLSAEFGCGRDVAEVVP